MNNDTLKKQALEFYAPQKSYSYRLTKGINYIWNDQGRIARQALEEIKKLEKVSERKTNKQLALMIHPLYFLMSLGRKNKTRS